MTKEQSALICLGAVFLHVVGDGPAKPGGERQDAFPAALRAENPDGSLAPVYVIEAKACDLRGPKPQVGKA